MNKNIDDLDKEIIKLISRRSQLYIDELQKKGGKFEAKDLYEEKTILFEKIKKLNEGPIPVESIKKIYNEIITSSFSAATPFRVAYFGPAGTYTHSAMLNVFGESVDSVALKTIPDVFSEVESGRVSLGIVPIENSTEGAVTYTLDELLETDLMIVSEKFLRISHSLVSLCTDLKDIKTLYTHPQPLGQCKGWLRKNLPDVEIHHSNSTSLAAETASWDKYSAAIASETSAKIYKLNILRKNIEDSKRNFTRFLIIGKEDNPPSGRDKTSIVCAVKDRAGALYNLLKPFSETGVNMTKIESRPDKKKMWAYNFFIDFHGHRDDTVIKKTIETMKKETVFFKILGSYPISDDED